MENVFLMVSAIEEFIFKNQKRQVVENLFPEKRNRNLLESRHF